MNRGPQKASAQPQIRQFLLAANDLELCVTDHGDARNPPLLLIHGLGQSQLDWPPALLAALVARGLRVITFDNRDIGQSTRLTKMGAPPLLRLWFMARLGWQWPALTRPSYGIADMALDTLALMNALELEAVHLVGASMGGMVAQHVAARCPSRVRSQVCIMSSPGGKGLPAPRPDVAKAMAGRPAATTPGAATLHALALRRLLAGALGAADAAELEVRVHNTTHYGWPQQDGAERQFAAILADTGRPALVATIKAPTLVIHGVDDPLLPVAHGRALANAIAGARFVPIAAMGHEITATLSTTLADLVADHVEAMR